MNKKAGNYAHPRLVSIGVTPIDLKFGLTRTNMKQKEAAIDFCSAMGFDLRVWKGSAYIKNVNPQYIQFFIDLFNGDEITL